jgi:hypothetical protein
METVETVSLAHIHFLRHHSSKVEKGDALDFGSLLALLTCYAEDYSHGKKTSDGTEALVKNLPFFLAQSDFTPYLLLAITTDAPTLAKYLQEPNSAPAKEAIKKAVEASLLMDAPELTEAVLSFFELFARWCSCTPDYLSAMGWTKSEAKLEKEPEPISPESPLGATTLTPTTSDY